jgi:hypothetical protein
MIHIFFQLGWTCFLNIASFHIPAVKYIPLGVVLARVVRLIK